MFLVCVTRRLGLSRGGSLLLLGRLGLHPLPPLRRLRRLRLVMRPEQLGLNLAPCGRLEPRIGRCCKQSRGTVGVGELDVARARERAVLQVAQQPHALRHGLAGPPAHRLFHSLLRGGRREACQVDGAISGRVVGWERVPPANAAVLARADRVRLGRREPQLRRPLRLGQARAELSDPREGGERLGRDGDGGLRLVALHLPDEERVKWQRCIRQVVLQLPQQRVLLLRREAGHGRVAGGAEKRKLAQAY
mmetsp:Transcript_18058/g.59092  ORF Transcript_18058/g.59092 Transcript_18058/m.59092 type:complete len:249 (-) Transcript_18058:935-1681(-)